MKTHVLDTLQMQANQYKPVGILVTRSEWQQLAWVCPYPVLKLKRTCWLEEVAFAMRLHS